MNLNLLYSVSVGRSLSGRNCEAIGGWRRDEPSQSEVNLSCFFSQFADSYLQFTQWSIQPGSWRLVHHHHCHHHHDDHDRYSLPFMFINIIFTGSHFQFTQRSHKQPWSWRLAAPGAEGEEVPLDGEAAEQNRFKERQRQHRENETLQKVIFKNFVSISLKILLKAPAFSL